MSSVNFPLFVARRLRLRPDDETEAGFSGTVSSIAVWSVGLGTALLLIAFSVLYGFRYQIQEKLFSFGAHIQVTRFSNGSEYEDNPVSTQARIYQNPGLVPEIAHIQAYCQKAALLKTPSEVQGVLLKGLGPDFNLSQFRQNISEGRFIKFGSKPSVEAVISQTQAAKLNLKTGSTLVVYFMQNPPRARKLTVCGIYETGLEDFDENTVLCDRRLLQELDNRPDSLVSGFEIFIKDFDNLDQSFEHVYHNLNYDLTAQKTTESHFQIFEWLSMIGRNVQVLLVLITLVSCFNMVSTLLIMMLERTRMIGVLKALGAGDKQIKSIFILSGLRICLRGLLLGNAIGLGLCALQYYFRLIPLDAENYYMSYVPIAWPWPAFLFVNLLTVLLCGCALLIPAVTLSRIKPAEAVKYA